MTLKWDELAKSLTDNNLIISQYYTVDSQIKFISVLTSTKRLAFMLCMPEKAILHTTHVSIVIEPTEMNYKTFNQQTYLSFIKNMDVACLSSKNLCIKRGNEYQTWNFDSIIDSDPTDIDAENAVDDIDIKIDDYPIHELYPVIDTKFFFKNISTIETIIAEKYNVISNFEEEYNEVAVKELLNKFDEQKIKLKDTFYQLHLNCYNIRRDIEKVSGEFNKAIQLRNNCIDKSDRVRFRIDRLIKDAQDTLDRLNNELAIQRNNSNTLLNKYRSFLSTTF